MKSNKDRIARIMDRVKAKRIETVGFEIVRALDFTVKSNLVGLNGA